MKYHWVIILVTCAFFFTAKTFAQSDGPATSPEIGEACPPFVLGAVDGNVFSSISSKEMKGKYFILDFWNLHCSSCITSFEHLNAMQKKYIGKLQIILVGSEDSRSRSFYREYKKKKALILSSAFDSAIFRKFHVFAVPHEIWVDSSGKVKAITQIDAVTEKNIRSFIDGQDFDFREKKENDLAIDFTRPILVNGNGGNDSNFYFRSILAPFLDMRGFSSLVRDSTSRVVVNGGISTLYSVAFGGTVPYPNKDNGWPFPYNRIVLEVKDSSRFYPPYKNGLFFYELDVPKPVTVNTRQIMREELDRMFNLTAFIEKRVVEVLELICSDSTLLFTSGTSPSLKDSLEGFSMQNKPVKTIAEELEGYLGEKIPLIDETHCARNADIQFQADMTDLQEVRLAIKPYGLDIIKGERLLDMLIIREKTKPTGVISLTGN